MFAVPLTNNSTYAELGLYPRDRGSLPNIVQHRLENADAFYLLIEKLSNREGGLAPRLKFIKAVANGWDYCINRSTVTTDIRKDPTLFKSIKADIADDSITGIDWYAGLDDDIRLARSDPIVVPNAWFTLPERIDMIIIDHPVFLRDMKPFMAQVRDVLHVQNVTFNDIDMFRNEFIIAYFRQPFTIYDFTNLSRRFDFDKYYLINESNLSDAMLIKKHNMPESAKIVSISTLKLTFVRPNNLERTATLFIRDTFTNWIPLVAKRASFKSLLDILFLKAKANNDNMYLSITSVLIKVEKQPTSRIDVQSQIKWNDMIKAINESKSLERISIVGPKGAGKSKVIRFIDEYRLPGLNKRVYTVDSDTYGKWYTMHCADKPFDMVASINEVHLKEIERNDTVQSVFNHEMEKILIKHTGSRYITASTNSTPAKAQDFLRSFSEMERVLQDFSDVYTMLSEGMNNFFNTLVSKIQEPENTVLLTFLHTTSESSRAPGTRFNYHLKTIFYPGLAVIERNRSPIVEWLLCQFYDRLGANAFTPIEPYMILDPRQVG
uniref:Structural protein n=1 Tax=Elemess virus TaxID=2800913 RepID=A0A894KCY2_9VIRU|nr:MAG: structural protein [Elemess virus]